jgi:hypothetical protein
MTATLPRSAVAGVLAGAVATLCGVSIGVAGARAAAPSAGGGLESLPLAARAPISAALLGGRLPYSLRGDPFAQEGELSARHGASGEEFGESVAVSSNTIVVGTPNYVVGSTEDGAVHVFTRPASGWAHAVQTAVLTVRGGQSEELFGHSVAISGETIVVGAPFRGVANGTGEGAAYVFVKPASGWRSATQTAKLTPRAGDRSEFFGESVAISGNTIVGGAAGREVGGRPARGAVDVFTRPAAGWAGSLDQTATLTASDGAAHDALGIAVAISGDAVVAGADLHRVGSGAEHGAAYVFVRRRGRWANAVQSAELTDASDQPGEWFAHAVAISGDTIVVGAPNHAGGDVADEGAAYVFEMPTHGWVGLLTETAELTASDGAKDELLGHSLGISGDVVVLGGDYKQVGKNPQQGAMYVFVEPATGWADATQTAELTAPDGAAGDSLGRSVAVFGNTIVAGAPDHAVRGSLGQGVAYVFSAAAPSRR